MQTCRQHAERLAAKEVEVQAAQQAAQRAKLEAAALPPTQQALARLKAELRTLRLTTQDDKAQMQAQMRDTASANARALELCEGRVRALETDLMVRFVCSVLERLIAASPQPTTKEVEHSPVRDQRLPCLSQEKQFGQGHAVLCHLAAILSTNSSAPHVCRQPASGLSCSNNRSVLHISASVSWRQKEPVHSSKRMLKLQAAELCKASCGTTQAAGNRSWRRDCRWSRP